MLALLFVACNPCEPLRARVVTSEQRLVVDDVPQAVVDLLESDVLAVQSLAQELLAASQQDAKQQEAQRYGQALAGQGFLLPKLINSWSATLHARGINVQLTATIGIKFALYFCFGFF